jgi:diaminopimelate epimerase
MKIKFCKYQGTGNDFILINNIDGAYNNIGQDEIRFLCDRKFGIGSDGLILLNYSVEHDFYMEFSNPDGSKSFCGNGARCAVQFAGDSNLLSSHGLSFEAIDGVHKAELCGGEVKLEMSSVGMPLNVELVSIDSVPFTKGFFLDTGSPHLALPIDSLKELETKNLLNVGQKIRYSKKYEDEGINVNLLFVHGEDELSIATYERGVENETLSCGTGATACALIHAAKEINAQGLIKVRTKGGLLQVSYESNGKNKFTKVYLIGPAKLIYEGTIGI